MPSWKEALSRARQRRGEDVVSLASEFVEPYGLDVQPPFESSPFAIHDGAHRFTNAPATIYGELLQNVSDKAAMSKLYGSGFIQGNPANYRQVAEGTARPSNSSSFVNYGSMPDVNKWQEFRDKNIRAGASPRLFEQGQEYGWDADVARRITAQQQDLEGILDVSNKRFKQGDFTFFQGAGSYDPEKGFMPSPDLRNTREISPQDLNTARVRGEAFADAMMDGYNDAIREGRYAPQRPVVRGMHHAADLSDAAMSGRIRTGRGWADEGIFPYQDRVGALSNPPALLTGAPDDVMGDIELANRARNIRARDLTRNTIRSTTAGAAALGSALPLTSEPVWRAVGRGDIGDAAKQVAVETGVGLAASPVIGAAGGVLQRLAPSAASPVLGTLGAAAFASLPTQATQALSGFLEEKTGKGLPVRTMEAQDTAAGMTPSMQAASPRRTYSEGWITVPGKGRRWRDSQGNYFMQQPGVVRTAPAQTARQLIPQLFPEPRSVMANTPSGVAQLTQTRQQNPLIREALNRVNLFRQRFNPAQGEFGLTELLLGR